MRRCVCRIGYQPHCQGQNWTVVTLLIENGRASSVCSNLQTDLPIRAAAHKAARVMGSLQHIIFAFPPQRSRVQMTFVSHQMLRGRCHSVYCHGDLLVENDHSHGEEHIKTGPGAGEGERLNAKSSQQLSSHSSQDCTFCFWLLFGHLLSSEPLNYTAKQTRTLCQMISPSFCSDNSTPPSL